MTDLLAVLYVIWSAGSLITVIVSFICWLAWPNARGAGIAALVWLLSLGSMIGAIVVGG